MSLKVTFGNIKVLLHVYTNNSYYSVNQNQRMNLVKEEIFSTELDINVI